MRDSSNNVYFKEKESLSKLMEIFIKDNGKKALKKVLESKNFQTVYMWDSFEMMRFRVKELFIIQMDENMKASGKMGWEKEEEYYIIRMERVSKEYSNKIPYKEENIIMSPAVLENNMMDIFKIINLKEEEK